MKKRLLSSHFKAQHMELSQITPKFKQLSALLLFTFSAVLTHAQGREKLITKPDTSYHPVIKGDYVDISAQPGGSSYRLIDEGKDERYTTVQVIIRSSEGPLMRGNVALANKENKTVVRYMTDEKGFAYFQLFETKDLNSLIVDDLGYYRVVIPISKIKNKRSRIEVTLQGQSTSN